MSMYLVTEDVYLPQFDPTSGEFHDELVASEGSIVYRFDGVTYGCISTEGVACSNGGPHQTPFFELPASSLRPWIDGVGPMPTVTP